VAQTLAALTFAAISATPATAQTFVLDFAGELPFEYIPPTYGTVPGLLSVANRSATGWGDTPTAGCTHVRMYPTGYAGLTEAVATCDAPYIGEFVLVPWPGSGQTVTLESLRLGASQGGTHPWQVRVYDNLWNLLFQQSGIGSASAVTVTPNVSTAVGMYVQWGDSFFTGIDDVVLTVAPTQVAPEPGTVALLAGGLVGIAAGARGRRRR
jgi:hypothetical protein